MADFKHNNTFKYNENNISFGAVESAKDDNTFTFMCSVALYSTSKEIEGNVMWDSMSFINCVDINWNKAQLYGTGDGISLTTNLLNYIKNIDGILNNKSRPSDTNSTITYNKCEKGSINFDKMIARTIYDKGADHDSGVNSDDISIETNLEWDSQYFMNCINIDWNQAQVNDTTLNTSGDVINLIRDFLNKIESIV